MFLNWRNKGRLSLSMCIRGITGRKMKTLSWKKTSLNTATLWHLRWLRSQRSKLNSQMWMGVHKLLYKWRIKQKRHVFKCLLNTLYPLTLRICTKQCWKCWERDRNWKMQIRLRSGKIFSKIIRNCHVSSDTYLTDACKLDIKETHWKDLCYCLRERLSRILDWMMMMINRQVQCRYLSKPWQERL